MIIVITLILTSTNNIVITLYYSIHVYSHEYNSYHLSMKNKQCHHSVTYTEPEINVRLFTVQGEYKIDWTTKF